MDPDFVALGVLAAIGLAVLAVNIAVWLTPWSASGGLCLRAGAVLFDLGLVGIFLSQFLPSKWEFEYLDEPVPLWTTDLGVALSLGVMVLGLALFAAGFGLSRRARPVVPPEARLHEQGPPPTMLRK